MSHILEYLFPAMWIGYLAYWQIMSVNVKTAQRKEPRFRRWARSAAMFCAAALLGSPRMPLPLLERRFLPMSVFWAWTGAAITAAGLLFAIWARAHLGKNWSRSVTIKESHELIVTGPYAFVRHPIYTGLLTAFAGTALARGEVRGLLAVALLFAIFWPKLRLEEDWMQERFGEVYEAYARRVRRLVPYIW